LKRVSTGDFQEAMSMRLVKDAPGLSARTSRLKESWKDEQQRWSRRDLSQRRYVYLWVDGIHFGVRLARQRPVAVSRGKAFWRRSSCGSKAPNVDGLNYAALHAWPK
jgi:hypothetical protein